MRVPSLRRTPKLQVTIPPEARTMVRRILAEEQPLRTQELYERIHRQFVEVPGAAENRAYWARQRIPQPEHPDHPIRSMRFLKQYVLKNMAERNEVRKIMIRRKPLTSDEKGELERKIAKVERRNERKLREGQPPSGYVPLEVRAWKWVLADWKETDGEKLETDVPQHQKPPHFTSHR